MINTMEHLASGTFTPFPVLDLAKQGARLAHNSRAVMSQVGWLGHSGSVYALADEPRDRREPGGYSPLYIQIGVWEYLGDGKYGIKD
jgi:hypothetical protein